MRERERERELCTNETWCVFVRERVFFFFLVNEKWVKGVISVASLLKRDHSNTLPTPGRNPILPVYEKLTYYFFRPFGMEMKYKEYQHTVSY